MSVPVLKTQLLWLREPMACDAAAVLVFRGGGSAVLAAAAAFIDFLRRESAADLRRHWAITTGGEVIGLIGLHTWEHHHRRAEFGYDISRAHWGGGIAAEAAQAVIDHGFGPMGLHRIQAHTIADNHRSVRLLERLGFRREAAAGA